MLDKKELKFYFNSEYSELKIQQIKQALHDEIESLQTKEIDKKEIQSKIGDINSFMTALNNNMSSDYWWILREELKLKTESLCLVDLKINKTNYKIRELQESLIWIAKIKDVIR